MHLLRLHLLWLHLLHLHRIHRHHRRRLHSRVLLHRLHHRLLVSGTRSAHSPLLLFYLAHPVEHYVKALLSFLVVGELFRLEFLSGQFQLELDVDFAELLCSPSLDSLDSFWGRSAFYSFPHFFEGVDADESCFAHLFKLNNFFRTRPPLHRHSITRNSIRSTSSSHRPHRPTTTTHRPLQIPHLIPHIHHSLLRLLFKLFSADRVMRQSHEVTLEFYDLFG